MWRQLPPGQTHPPLGACQWAGGGHGDTVAAQLDAHNLPDQGRHWNRRIFNEICVATGGDRCLADGDDAVDDQSIAGRADESNDVAWAPKFNPLKHDLHRSDEGKHGRPDDAVAAAELGFRCQLLHALELVATLAACRRRDPVDPPTAAPLRLMNGEYELAIGPDRR